MAPEELKAAVTQEEELVGMGFNIPRLGYYRWLVLHGRDPEYVGVKPARIPAEEPHDAVEGSQAKAHI